MLADVQMGSLFFIFLLSVILGRFWSAVKVEQERGECSAPAQPERADLGGKLGAGRGEAGQGVLWVKTGFGASEVGALSLTCIPQKYSHRLSLAETRGLCVRPPSLWLVREEDSH